ncbi:uncharacterized protein TNCV_3532351 [Trichonephila clavipes]|nr:uncharacterized protein TNCV_3532351 [Trichonephila clavipes]
MLKKRRVSPSQFADESRFYLQHYNGQFCVRRHLGERLLNCYVMNHLNSSAPGIMDWGGIGFHCQIPLVRIVSTVNNQHYISEVLEPVVLSYIERLSSAIFLQDNA